MIQSPSLRLPPIEQKRRSKPEIKLLCTNCEEEIDIRTWKEHKEFHSALQTFRYSMENKPSSVKQLLKRRRGIMRRLNEDVNSENPLSTKKLQKLNIAYELLKSHVEGTVASSRKLEGVSCSFVNCESVNLSSALAFGVCQSANPRWKTSMEDRYAFKDFFCNDPQSGFFAIYDGYGGPMAAEKCARHFHEILESKVERVYQKSIKHSKLILDIVAAFKEAYDDMDKILLQGVNEHSRNRWSGCSALTCLLRGNNLFVANAGNVRAVLCRGDGSIERVSYDHSPWDKTERRRVRKANGDVSKSERTALVNGLVSSTRGLGNHGDPNLKVSVTHRPVVNCIPLEDSDQFMILASNGVWDVLNEEEVILLMEDIIPDLDVKAIIGRMQQRSSALASGSVFDSRKDDILKQDSEDDDEEPMEIPRREETVKSYWNEQKNLSPSASMTFSRGSREEKACELAQALSERLVEGALLAGSRDNVTVSVVLLKGCPLQMFLLPSLWNTAYVIHKVFTECWETLPVSYMGQRWYPLIWPHPSRFTRMSSSNIMVEHPNLDLATQYYSQKLRRWPIWVVDQWVMDRDSWLWCEPQWAHLMVYGANLYDYEAKLEILFPPKNLK